MLAPPGTRLAVLSALIVTSSTSAAVAASAVAPAAGERADGGSPATFEGLSLALLAGGAKVMQGDLGPMLRAELVVPLLRSRSGLPLALVVPFSASHSGRDDRDVEVDALALELVPAVRLGVALAARLSLFADAGVGVVHARVRMRTERQFIGKLSEVASQTTALFRFALGLELLLNEQFGVSFEPVGLAYGFDGGASFGLLAGASYKP